MNTTAVPGRGSEAKTGCSTWGLREYLSEAIVSKLRYWGWEAQQGGPLPPKETAWCLSGTAGG